MRKSVIPVVFASDWNYYIRRHPQSLYKSPRGMTEKEKKMHRNFCKGEVGKICGINEFLTQSVNVKD